MMRLRRSSVRLEMDAFAIKRRARAAIDRLVCAPFRDENMLDLKQVLDDERANLASLAEAHFNPAFLRILRLLGYRPRLGHRQAPGVIGSRLQRVTGEQSGVRGHGLEVGQTVEMSNFQGGVFVNTPFLYRRLPEGCPAGTRLICPVRGYSDDCRAEKSLRVGNQSAPQAGDPCPRYRAPAQSPPGLRSPVPVP